MPLKVGLCATESSGDILGSDLIRNLKSKDPLIEFYGLGGSEMRKEGFNSFDSNEELQVMGLIDPIFKINRIKFLNIIIFDMSKCRFYIHYLFPLDGCGRFRSHVIHDSTYAFHFIHYSC